MEKFSKVEAIKFGWEVAKNNIDFLIRLALIIILIELLIEIPVLLNDLPQFRNFALIISIIQLLIAFVWRIVEQIGLTKISLDLCYHQKSKISELFSHYRLFFRFLIGGILYGLIVLVGLILLIVPGIVWAIQFQFYPYLILEKGLRPIEALRKSSKITKGVRWDLFVFALMLFGVALGMLLISVVPILLLLLLSTGIYNLVMKINFIISAWFLILMTSIISLIALMLITMIPIILLISYAYVYSKLVSRIETQSIEPTTQTKNNFLVIVSLSSFW
jgi:uncharacterized membrane protein